MTRSRRLRLVPVVAAIAVMFAVGIVYAQLPAIAAGGLLHPHRSSLLQPRPANCDDATFPGAGVTLHGWTCHASETPQATLVYLHGIADNRGSAVNVIERFAARGFDVIAFDSRAHGESEGDACTYGYFEKEDLKRVLDVIDHHPIVLMGASLGAAVAIQEAADDPRVKAVVAAETFSDLRTVAQERAPWILNKWAIDSAFRVAERQGGFIVDEVSPSKAAERIHIPVLLVHGRQDRETPPDHSQRVLAALKGPKRLILVEGAGHNQSLQREGVWVEIEAWLQAEIKD